MKRPQKENSILLIASAAVDEGRILYSSHANLRLKERAIIKPEVEFVLSHGRHEARKDRFNTEFDSWDYSIRGRTLDGRNLRIIVALLKPNLLVITAIDLDQ